MARANTRFITPGDIFDKRRLSSALGSLGDYVYGYYRPGELSPFYVGKGKGKRVLDHWEAACKGKSKLLQCVEIRKILAKGDIPNVRILAHDLQKTRREDVYSVVERILQNTFGIERLKKSVIGYDRVAAKPTLLQYRDDGKKHPAMSLEATYCMGSHKSFDVVDPHALATELDAPILLVGITKSFHARYFPHELAQMARCYWNLRRFENTSLPALRGSQSAVLAAWTSTFGGPQIAGIWRIKRRSFEKSSKGRYLCDVDTDNELRRRVLGCRLLGTGNGYQGPRIYLPDS